VESSRAGTVSASISASVEKMVLGVGSSASSEEEQAEEESGLGEMSSSLDW